MNGPDENSPDKPEHEGRPGPIIHIGHQGAASPDGPVSTTDPHPSSALGGHAAARSAIAPEIDPDQEQR